VSRSLVIGGSGYLGQELLRILGSTGVGTYSTNAFVGGIPFDASTQKLGSLLEQIGSAPEVVYLLHGIANPDFCAKNVELTYEVNVAKMKELVRDIWEMGGTPVYMSTDYVFDGTCGLRTEQESKCPTTEYGRQKAEVEDWLAENESRYLICRSSKIVSGDLETHSVLGQWVNDIRDGRPLRCAVDQIFSPAHVGDTARAVHALTSQGACGLYNVAGREPISRYDLAKHLLDRVESYAPAQQSELLPINLADVPFYEMRPLNTSLNVEKLDGALDWRFRALQEVCDSVAVQHFG
jgi:dTDP-4-dehydrorhamnose reductase